jgi:hypothetical protein
LNVVVAKHGVPEPKFKGFMADSAQANWNVVRIIYKSGDVAIPIKRSGENMFVPLDTILGEAYEGRHPSRPPGSTLAAV